MKKIKQKVPQHKFVLRILPNEFIITSSFISTKLDTTSTLIRWKLPKQVDPNNINPDLELLSSNLASLTKEYGIEGNQLSVVLPHSFAPLQTLDIPLDLSSKADKKEYLTLSKQPYEFWKEFDEHLVDFKEAEIRATYIHTNTSDGTSKMLQCAVSSKIIQDHITMILGGNLYPTSFVSEDQSIIKFVESRLTRVERERSICIFHLSKGNNKLIHVSHEEINVAKVDISELDETLLEDLPDDEKETANEFWSEVSTRLSGALKQAVTFLKEEQKVAKFDSIFFISDYDKEKTLFKLFHKNFRLANFRSIEDHCVYKYHQKLNSLEETPSANNSNEYFYSTKVIPNAGCYKLEFYSVPSILNLIIHSNIFNLHPKYKFIETNFKYIAPYQKLRKILATVFIIFLPIYLYLEASGPEVSNEESNVARLTQQLKAETQKYQEKQNTINQTSEKLIQLNEYLKGKNNQDFFKLINNKLPSDLELERVILTNQNFILYGNSLSISEIDRFYETLLSKKFLKNIVIDSYKRSDTKLNFFQFSGEIINNEN